MTILSYISCICSFFGYCFLFRFCFSHVVLYFSCHFGHYTIWPITRAYFRSIAVCYREQITLTQSLHISKGSLPLLTFWSAIIIYFKELDQSKSLMLFYAQFIQFFHSLFANLLHRFLYFCSIVS